MPRPFASPSTTDCDSDGFVGFSPLEWGEAFFSRTDGIVVWRACIDHHSPGVRDHHVISDNPSAGACRWPLVSKPISFQGCDLA